MQRIVRPHILTILLTMAAIATPFIVLRHFERPRIIEGTWLWQFEGSMFYEGVPSKNPCDLLKSRGSWLNYEPEKVLGSYDYRKEYPSSGVYSSEHGEYRMEAFSVKFAGHQSFSLFGTGHMNGWQSENYVYQMLSAKPIPSLRCKMPFP